MEKILKDCGQTEQVAKALSAYLRPPVIVAFTGGLGVGKTTFIKYLCKYLGYDGHVTSPTFSIMNQYDGKYPIYHYDMYRLSGAQALDDIGFYDFYDSGISLVEWSENVEDGLYGNMIHVNMFYAGDKRKIIIPEIDNYEDA